MNAFAFCLFPVDVDVLLFGRSLIQTVVECVAVGHVVSSKYSNGSVGVVAFDGTVPVSGLALVGEVRVTFDVQKFSSETAVLGDAAQVIVGPVCVFLFVGVCVD